MKTIAIYPGSFNPFTVGHQNILEKAERMFGEVIVAVGTNPTKPHDGTYTVVRESFVALDKTAPRHEILSHQLNRNVETYDGYLTNYIKSKRDGETRVILIRGLRNGDDLDYEINQLRVMEDLLGSFGRIDVVFIACDREFDYISSTMCRQMEAIEKNSSLRYIASVSR